MIQNLGLNLEATGWNQQWSLSVLPILTIVRRLREIGDRLGIEVENVIAGIKPAKEALDEAAAYAAEVLKKTGKIK